MSCTFPGSPTPEGSFVLGFVKCVNPEMSVGGQEASGGPLLRGQTSGALLPSAVTCLLCHLELSLGLFCKMGIEKPVSSLLPPPLTSLSGWATMRPPGRIRRARGFEGAAQAPCLIS